MMSKDSKATTGVTENRGKCIKLDLTLCMYACNHLCNCFVSNWVDFCIKIVIVINNNDVVLKTKET